MEKETPVQCVPLEMMARLKKLLSRLWEENNPAGVHLGAIMDEFGSDIKALSGVIREYETDYSSRLKAAKEEHREKVQALESELAVCRGRLSGLEKTRGETSKKVAELEEALRGREAECSMFSVRLTEEESQLNSKYVAKMQELYDRVNRKEREMFAGWEEKNKALEAKYGALDGKYNTLETEYGAKARQFKLREKALEDEFRARKGELIKTFDKIRLELDAREADISAREEKLAGREK